MESEEINIDNVKYIYGGGIPLGKWYQVAVVCESKKQKGRYFTRGMGDVAPFPQEAVDRDVREGYAFSLECRLMADEAIWRDGEGGLWVGHWDNILCDMNKRKIGEMPSGHM